jgi:hypothetical protein
LFSNDVYDTIQQGKIAVISDFLSAADVAVLHRDAANLHRSNYFSTPPLASYGTSVNSDPSKDRTVVKPQQWKNTALGDWNVRKQLGARMQSLRSDLTVNLNRPGLGRGTSTTAYGEGSTEISYRYSRFGPGAFLERHVDVYHEERKGVAGWSQPTRRSLSWLIYLNADWNPDVSGGCLRCYERAARPSHVVGARPNGDLQIGWLRPSLLDPVERPVFLDAQRGDGSTDNYCAMYIDDPSGSGQAEYITKNFNAHPTLYMAGVEFWKQKLLMAQRRDFADRFQFIEAPKSVVTEWWNRVVRRRSCAAKDESPVEVPPLAGTLVIFDSVTLPHEVLPTVGRARWATFGWMHEDQIYSTNKRT